MTTDHTNDHQVNEQGRTPAQQTSFDAMIEGLAQIHLQMGYERLTDEDFRELALVYAWERGKLAGALRINAAVNAVLDRLCQREQSPAVAAQAAA
jgi:hypothetical protein